MLITQIVAFLFIGLISGILGGLFGIGGGIVFVPFQLLIYHFIGVPADIEMKMAIGTSLFATAFTTLASARAHVQHQAVIWELVYKIAFGVILGALMGAFFARIMPDGILEIFFGGVLCLLAVYLFFFIKLHDHETGHMPNFWLFNLIGIGTATISAMIGVSGGFFMVPILLFFHVPIRKAVGSSSAIGFLIASVAALGFLFPSLSSPTYPYAIGYLYFPALIPLAIGTMISARWGASLAHSLPMPILKRIFALVLLVVGILMIFRIS